MQKCNVKIVNKLGLHARASAKLTQIASKYGCAVWIARNGRRVNAKSIMGVMMLAAESGSTLMIRADGEDEGKAVAALADLVASGFGET